MVSESPLVYPYPKNTRNSDHGLSFPSPETQTMVWVSPFPNKYRVWGGLSFGPSFSRTLVWVSSREGRNTGVGVDEGALIRKIRAPIKIKSAPPPPNPPPKKRGILRTWFFLQKERIFPGVHKIGAPISGPRITDTNFTDTRIFLNWVSSLCQGLQKNAAMKLSSENARGSRHGKLESVKNPWRRY